MSTLSKQTTELNKINFIDKNKLLLLYNFIFQCLKQYKRNQRNMYKRIPY